MSKLFFLVSSLFLLLLMTACPRSVPVKPEVVTKIANYQISQLDTKLAAYETAVRAGTTSELDKARRIRNATVHNLIRVIDNNYFQFENELYLRRASGSFLADAVDMSANLAATITNGARVKTIINASLIAFRGGRKSASIHYFQEQTADVLITKMQTSRNRILADMLRQLRDSDVDTYPIEAALGDVIKYFYAGSLPRALQELKTDTSIAAQAADDEVRKVSGLPERRLVTTEIRDDAKMAMQLLNKLSVSLGIDAEKQTALERLQAIVKEAEQDADLKSLLTSEQITATTTDGVKIFQALKKIKRELARRSDDEETVAKFNKIIVKFGQ